MDINTIKSELLKAGIVVNDIYDLVNTKKSYESAIPILLDVLEQGIEDNTTKEGVIRALAVKAAIGIASPILIKEYNRIPKGETILRWVIGNTIFTTITEEDTEEILAIVQDATNGISRQMFVAALGKVKSEKSEKVLITLLDDNEVATHAIEALGRRKSQKAKDKILNLINHPKALLRKEAQKALKKIG